MRAIPMRSWMLAVVSAVLQILPFPIAGPVPLWRRLFCWFCVTPLLLAILGSGQEEAPLTPRRAALVGYLCGTLWYLGNCYWIYPTMHIYGGIPGPAALGILLLFSLYLGLYHALFGWTLGVLSRRFTRTTVLCLSPLLWVTVELARASITGFPWDPLGNTQVDNLVISRLATVTGVMGLSFLVAIVNALWLLRTGKRDRMVWYAGPILALLVVAGALGTSFMRVKIPGDNLELSKLPPIAVLLQDNLNVGSQRQPNNETRQAMMEDFARWSLHPDIEMYKGERDGKPDGPYYVPAPTSHLKPDIIAWPEAPTDFVSSDPDFRKLAGDVARKAHTPLISDSVGVDGVPGGVTREYVSAAFFDADGNYVGRYDKMHLVPFGEYVPYKQLFFFVGHLLDGLPFSPGAQRTLFQTNGHSYGTFICYESIFGDEIRQFALNGADVLVNLSDDGWYGDSSAPWEHLDMARMRAIENNRWVLRSTNTGLTTAIDPYGRDDQQLPRHIRAALAVSFEYRRALTFYTKHGDWIAWVCALASVMVLGMSFTGRWSGKASSGASSP